MENDCRHALRNANRFSLELVEPLPSFQPPSLSSRNALPLLLLPLSMGNEKANGYWEKETPPNIDRSGTEKFIRVKYDGRMWVAKNAKQPAPEPVDKSIHSNNLVKGGATSGAPKKTRRHSLEEAMLFTNLAEAAPTVARPRGGSLDLNHKFTTSPPAKGPPPTMECDTVTKKINNTTHLFGLLYVHDAKQKRR